MNISTIPVQKHTKLDFDEHTTHVFTFAERVSVESSTSHPAIATLIANKSYSSYLLLTSSCPKTIRLKIFKEGPSDKQSNL